MRFEILRFLEVYCLFSHESPPAAWSCSCRRNGLASLLPRLCPLNRQGETLKPCGKSRNRHHDKPS